MQDIDSTICERVYPYDQTTTLIDKRDNKTYTVAKLKMTPEGTQATCWMTQNLALVLGTKLTNELTDLNSVTEWTPVRGTIATGSLNTTTWKDDNNTPYSYNSGNTNYGVYYNWSAAVASNNTSTLTTAYTNAPDSVCPKGWRLPKAYDGSASNMSNEFGNLLYSYSIMPSPIAATWAANGFAKIQQDPVKFVIPSFVVGGRIENLASFGVYWSSNIGTDPRNAFYLFFSSTVVNPIFQAMHAGPERWDGYSVRCILR